MLQGALEAARLWMQLQGRPVMLQAALEAARLWMQHGMQLPHQGLRVGAVSVEAEECGDGVCFPEKVRSKINVNEM